MHKHVTVELPELERTLLENQAVSLVKQYGMVLMVAPPVKAFFKRLAVHLKWEKLEKAL